MTFRHTRTKPLSESYSSAWSPFPPPSAVRNLSCQCGGAKRCGVITPAAVCVRGIGREARFRCSVQSPAGLVSDERRAVKPGARDACHLLPLSIIAFGIHRYLYISSPKFGLF